MDIYAQNILDHFKNPRNHGQIANPTITNREANHSCGDVITIYLYIKDHFIQDFKFRGEGCAISQAAMSILGEGLAGMSIDDTQKIDQKFLFELLGINISARRSKCALLGLLTLKNGLAKLTSSSSLRWVDLMK